MVEVQKLSNSENTEKCVRADPYHLDDVSSICAIKYQKEEEESNNPFFRVFKNFLN
jgi:hypothetical protein